MVIHTCYTVGLKAQLAGKYNKRTKSIDNERAIQMDDRVMRATSALCLEALKLCVRIFLDEWDSLSAMPKTPKAGRPCRYNAARDMVHSTKWNKARYPEFDQLVGNMPAGTMRMVIADALGMVSSYRSNHADWEALPPEGRGAEPCIGFPDRYGLTFYDQERKVEGLSDGKIGLKLFNGTSWEWYFFRIGKSDAAYLGRLLKTRKLLSPTVQKVRGRYQVRFCFREERDLVQNADRLSHTVLAVDLGINAPASWAVMTADGTVHAKGVIHLPCEEGRLNRMSSRKRMYQQAGKKGQCAYRWVNAANRALSIATAKAITDTAVRYSVDCIVFEHLDSMGKVKGRRCRERIHLWRKNDTQARVELMAHRHGMRISRVCAWGTSKLAFDGSGEVDRHSVYRFVHGRKVYNYSLCTFKTGKVYNCDLSAAQNIGARFFLREYAKLAGCPELPPTPQRTLCTLRALVCNGQLTKAA